eukprot:tig00000334_g24113.t1
MQQLPTSAAAAAQHPPLPPGRSRLPLSPSKRWETGSAAGSEPRPSVSGVPGRVPDHALPWGPSDPAAAAAALGSGPEHAPRLQSQPARRASRSSFSRPPSQPLLDLGPRLSADSSEHTAASSVASGSAAPVNVVPLSCSPLEGHYAHVPPKLGWPACVPRCGSFELKLRGVDVEPAPAHAPHDASSHHEGSSLLERGGDEALEDEAAKERRLERSFKLNLLIKVHWSQFFREFANERVAKAAEFFLFLAMMTIRGVMVAIKGQIEETCARVRVDPKLPLYFRNPVGELLMESSDTEQKRYRKAAGLGRGWQDTTIAFLQVGEA